MYWIIYIFKKLSVSDVRGGCIGVRVECTVQLSVSQVCCEGRLLCLDGSSKYAVLWRWFGVCCFLL